MHGHLNVKKYNFIYSQMLVCQCVCVCVEVASWLNVCNCMRKFCNNVVLMHLKNHRLDSIVVGYGKAFEINFTELLLKIQFS